MPARLIIVYYLKRRHVYIQTLCASPRRYTLSLNDEEKFSLLLYAFIGICVLRIGLSFYSRHLMTGVVETHDKIVLIEKEFEAFRHFDDSIAENESFRSRIFDTVRSVDHLILVKQVLGRRLEQKLIGFDKQRSRREAMLTRLEVIDGLMILSNVLLVILGLPIFIHLVRTR
jgi:hypothetical protein